MFEQLKNRNRWHNQSVATLEAPKVAALDRARAIFAAVEAEAAAKAQAEQLVRVARWDAEQVEIQRALWAAEAEQTATQDAAARWARINRCAGASS